METHIDGRNDKLLLNSTQNRKRRIGRKRRRTRRRIKGRKAKCSKAFESFLCAELFFYYIVGMNEWTFEEERRNGGKSLCVFWLTLRWAEKGQKKCKIGRNC
jgi:hypothetical protein